MKNTFGSSVSVTLFGESHGEMIGAVLDGLAPGIAVDEAFIEQKLTLRRPQGSISTKRVEPDRFQIVSGVYQGRTTGTPICILIPNENVNSAVYTHMDKLARPGHADYAARMKYHGFEDRRGGGHFSGRLTAPLVAAGAIAISALQAKGICIGTHIKKCAGIEDDGFEIPTLTIQPLVENAIRHGVRSRAEGLVNVTAVREAGAHRITVQDNGVGFDSEKTDSAKGTHVGIQNVKDRIEQMCGGTMILQSEIGIGTCVTLMIPDRTETKEHRK